MALKVLIVEDSATERGALKLYLQNNPVFSDFDLDIFEASDGEEGLNAFDEQHPHLLFVDLLLPKLDGIALCKRIRQKDIGKNVSIIANSGVYRDSQIVAQLEKIRVEFQAKPLDHKKLTTAIENVLAERKKVDPDVAKTWLKEKKEEKVHPSLKRSSRIKKAVSSKRPAGPALQPQRDVVSEEVKSESFPNASPLEDPSKPFIKKAVPLDKIASDVHPSTASGIQGMSTGAIPIKVTDTGSIGLVSGYTGNIGFPAGLKPGGTQSGLGPIEAPTSEPLGTLLTGVSHLEDLSEPLEEPCGPLRQWNLKQKGELDESPLASILMQLYAQKANGTLKLTRGKVRKVIFILSGKPIYVDSNLRNETLGAYLLAQKKIQEEDLSKAMREARATKKKLGQAIVNLGLADQSTINDALNAQTAIKVVSALRWSDGAYSFEPGKEFSKRVPHCPLDVISIALGAMCRFSDTQQLQSRFADVLDYGFRLTTMGQTYKDAIRANIGNELLADDNIGQTIRFLTNKAKDGTVFLTQLDALRVCGLAELYILQEQSESLNDPELEAPNDFEGRQKEGASGTEFDLVAEPIVSPKAAARAPEKEEKASPISLGATKVEDAASVIKEGISKDEKKAISQEQSQNVETKSDEQKTIAVSRIATKTDKEDRLEKSAADNKISKEKDISIAKSISKDTDKNKSRPGLENEFKTEPPTATAHPREENIDVVSEKEEPIKPMETGPNQQSTIALDLATKEKPKQSTSVPKIRAQIAQPLAFPPLKPKESSEDLSSLNADDAQVKESLSKKENTLVNEEASKADALKQSTPLSKNKEAPSTPKMIPKPSTQGSRLPKLQFGQTKAKIGEDGNQLIELNTKDIIKLEQKEKSSTFGLKQLDPTRTNSEKPIADVAIATPDESAPDWMDVESGVIEIPSPTELAAVQAKLEAKKEERKDISQPKPLAIPRIESIRDEAEVKTKDPSSVDSFGAELYFQEGEMLLKNNNIDGAVEAIHKAIEANPEQAEYHGVLGWALYLKHGRGKSGASAAQSHFERSFQICPDTIRIHELAGKIQEENHDYSRAASHYAYALRNGPVRIDLFTRIKEMLQKIGNYTKLEQHYRDLIMRMRESDPFGTLSLWFELADIYLEKLNQPENAKLALDVARKLAPNDPRIATVEYALGKAKEDLSEEKYEELVEGYRKQFLNNTTDVEPLHKLYALLQKRERRREQIDVGSILLVNGHATYQEREETLALRKMQAEQNKNPFSQDEFDRIRHPSDDLRTERIIATFADDLMEMFPVNERLGVAGAIDLKSVPASIANSLNEVCQFLSIELPALYLTSEPIGFAPLPGKNAGLIVGESMLETEEIHKIKFLATRALSSISPGRREVFVRRGTALKVGFLGALSAARPSVPVADPDGKVAEFRNRLVASGAVEPLRVLLDDLFGAGGKLNLSEWMRGVQRSAARIGMIMSGDLLTSLESLAEDISTRDDLIAFSLSEEYLTIVDKRG